MFRTTEQARNHPAVAGETQTYPAPTWQLVSAIANADSRSPDGS